MTTGDISSTLASTGWETMLGGLLNAGWQVDGTWPMRTELENRQVSRERTHLPRLLFWFAVRDVLMRALLHAAIS